MGKQLLRYSILVIALAAILFLIFRNNVPFGRSNTTFAVKPGTPITRFELIQGKKKVSLEESDGKWLLNKQEEARKSAVFFMLKVLREMKIKSPVSSELFESEIVKNNVEPVRVNVFSGRRLVKSIYVYKTASNLYGNIMKLKAFSKPFIVCVPGYEDNIGMHFIPDELFWKPFQVFHLLPSQISSVSMDIPADSSSSFSIINSGNGIQLTDMKKPVSGWDTSKVKRYLTYFTSVSFENWANALSEGMIDSIKSGKPVYRIFLKRNDGIETDLTVWEKWIVDNGVKKPDTDRVWAITNQNKEIFIMRYLDLDPLLKKRSYFFNRPANILNAR
jgi:hypothetical protein